MNISGRGWTGEVLVQPDEPTYAHVTITLWSPDEKIAHAALDFCVALLGRGRRRFVRRIPEIVFCTETGEWQGYTRFSYLTDIGGEEIMRTEPLGLSLFGFA